MATIYVDPLNGTDNADAGRGETDGTSAYASISYALANYGSFSTTTGNTIFLADTAADVLSSSIDTDTTVAKVESPLAIVGYHYDGSNGGTAGALTVNIPFGQSVSGGEIDGNDAVAYLFDANTTYTRLINLKLHSVTSYVLYFNGANSQCQNCEIYDGGITYTTFGGSYFNCLIDGGATGGIVVRGGNLMMGNEIKGGDEGIYYADPDSVCIGNLIYDFDDAGIQMPGTDRSIIANNTIDGTGGGADAIGIEALNANNEANLIFNNLITNFDGASSKGIYAPTGSPSWEINNNAFYNNTTDLDAPDSGYDGTNITESSDPYTDQAGGDYSLVSGASSNDAAIYTNHTSNIGAWQEKPTGGGGGETTSVFMA